MENTREEEIYKKIEAYVKGELTEKGIEELWVSIAKKPELLEDLEIEAGVRNLLEDDFRKSKKPAAKITRLSSRVWHISAAATVLLVALVQLFRMDTPTQIEQFVISDIPYDQLEMSDGIRSKEMAISSADSLLNLGFAAISSGDDKKALQYFDIVTELYDQEPYGSKAFLNKGIIHYNEREYSEAIQNFESSIERGKENRMISEKAYWFLGNAYINTGELEKALIAVGEAYNRDGVFRKDAVLLYQKLSYDLGKIGSEEDSAIEAD